MEALDRLSRYLGRTPDGRGSLEARALLPADLAPQFPSPALDALRDWARDIAERGGLVPVADLIERLEAQRPQKQGARRLNAAVDALARVGYGIAPDPQLSLRLPKATEPVVVFDLAGAEERPGEVSGAYRAAQVQIALGAFAAHADGDVAEADHAIADGPGDVIVSASTAGGKTEAAFLPLISSVLDAPDGAPGFDLVYVGPLRALISDQARRLEEICAETGVPVVP